MTRPVVILTFVDFSICKYAKRHLHSLAVYLAVTVTTNNVTLGCHSLLLTEMLLGGKMLTLFNRISRN